jgi:hypothetical protein
MTDDRYNGWTNRETWALNLWLTNDQGLYEMTRERVANEIAYRADGTHQENGQPWSLHGQRIAGEVVKALWEELTDPDEGLMTAENILKMVRDVGSDYRVDWDEVGACWLSDIAEDTE